jgi:hypothetical protein
MTRTVIGAAVGALLGVVALAVWGMVEGFCHGGAMASPAGASVPPGLHAAFLVTFVAVGYFWWLAAAVGAWVGGLIGLGSAAFHRWWADET